MKTETSKNISRYLESHSQATAKELAVELSITPQALFRQLKKLIDKGSIYKIGSPPRVFYAIKKTSAVISTQEHELPAAVTKILEKNYLIITPSGERKEGVEGFAYWCSKTNQPLLKTAQEYVSTLKKYEGYKKAGLVDGTQKLKSTFASTPLNKLCYLDFYSIERFGKTKLGQLLLYAKQSQNPALIRELVQYCKAQIDAVIIKWKIDGIGFIPPTVKREVQFMKELASGLHTGVSVIPLIKIKHDISVPQKTLSKLEDRIENARNTIMLGATSKAYKNILLIDDAVGSGSTINETAVKIRQSGICSGRILGLAITGSFKGFDVISEV